MTDHRTCPLDAHAAQVDAGLHAQDEAWGTSGWTRRSFVAGMGMVGAAALAGQFVTSRAAFSATPSSRTNTLIVVFMRGAADGLHVLVPNAPSLGLHYLRNERGPLVPGADELIPLPHQNGWALHSAVRPLYDELWASGELGFVPAVSAPGITRSHFAAQQLLEKGGDPSETTGWLDRALEGMGPGTRFRAVSVGSPTPLSMVGPVGTLALDTLAGFEFPGWDQIRAGSERAVQRLYRGMPGTLGADVPDTLAALSTARATRRVAKAGPQHGARYPEGDFSQALKDIAAMLRAEVGLQVATVDVGGWDTHTDEAKHLDPNLNSAARSLAAFMRDLGPVRRKRVTVVLQTEFGRRMQMNASGGTDHGHGSLMWLLGGGLARSGVYGKWQKLAPAMMDDGDLPGLNNPFDVYGELLTKRLSAGSLATVFPKHRHTPLGLARVG